MSIKDTSDSTDIIQLPAPSGAVHGFLYRGESRLALAEGRIDLLPRLGTWPDGWARFLRRRERHENRHGFAAFGDHEPFAGIHVSEQSGGVPSQLLGGSISHHGLPLVGIYEVAFRQPVN